MENTRMPENLVAPQDKQQDETPVVVPNHPDQPVPQADSVDPKSKDARSAAPGEGSGVTGEPAKRAVNDPERPRP